MAAIPTILKGDDSGAISITMATGRTYTGATLVVAYQGVTRSFANLTPGQTITITFTHEETANFALKTAPMLMRLIGQYGAEETVENAEARIRVTDCLAEVNAGGSFIVQPGGSAVDPTKVPITDVGDMAARYTLADLQAKVNQIVRVLAQRSLLGLLLSACCLASFGAVSTQTARLDALYNDSLVVTNVTGGGDVTHLDATNAALAVVGPVTNALTSVSNAAVSAYTVATNALPRADVTNAVDGIVGLEAVTNGANRYGLATTNLLTHYLSAHGGTATRADGETKGVEYTIQGGAEVRVGMSEEYLRGAKLSIGGGGGSYGDGGNGAEIVLGGGGSGDGSGGSGAKITLGSGSDGWVAGEGAQLVIGGHGSSTNEEDPTTYNGTLTITHTGDLSETLTERISRDAKYAITNDTQLWQDCASPVASNVLETVTTFGASPATGSVIQRLNSVESTVGTANAALQRILEGN